MIELLLSLVTSVFGVGAIVAAAAAVAAFLLLPAFGTRIAACLVVVAVTLAGVGFVDRLRTDLATAQGKVSELSRIRDDLVARAQRGEALAAENAAAAEKLTRQAAIDAAASDARLAKAKAAAARFADARVAAARALRCPAADPSPAGRRAGPGSDEDADASPSVQAAIDAMRARKTR